MTFAQAKKFVDLTISICSFKETIADTRRMLEMTRKDMRISKAKKITAPLFTYEDLLYTQKEIQGDLNTYLKTMASYQKKLDKLNEEIRKSFK
jgi:hypothetical protein